MERMMRMKCKLEDLFPPGYDYLKRKTELLWIWGMAVAYNSIFFLERYAYQRRNLFYDRIENGKVVEWNAVREGAMMIPFRELLGDRVLSSAQGITGRLFFLVLGIYLLLELVMHYLYYFRGSKSILTVRRMRHGKAFLWRTCVAGPALGLLLTAASILLLLLIYYGIYMIFTPAQCLP